MTFGLNAGQTDVTLTITAPERAREAADVLFERFIASAETGAACGCAPASNKKTKLNRSGTGKAAGSVAIVSAAGAAVACAACVIPFALPAVLLAGTGGVLAWLNDAHTWITGIAIAVLAFAWIWVWRQSAGLCMRPATSTLMMMGIATFFVALALLWPEIEPEILRLVGA